MKKTPRTYTKEQEAKIVELFRTIENNTIANISKLTGIGYSKVSTTINKFLEKKTRPINEIEVFGAIEIKPNGGFIAY